MTQVMAGAAIAVALLASTAANAAPTPFQPRSNAFPQMESPARPAPNDGRPGNPGGAPFGGNNNGGFHNSPSTGGKDHSGRGHNSQPHWHGIHNYDPYAPFAYPYYVDPTTALDGQSAYCPDPAGYYPVVRYCYLPWESVTE